MKKLLIIQTDSAYFLLETLNVLSKFSSAFTQFETTVLVDGAAYERVRSAEFDAIKGITFSDADVLAKKFDLSVNLSLNESSWELHGQLQTLNRVGPYRVNNETKVPDLWSSYLMTIKANVPFLTFHLQDIYKHILGIKKVNTEEVKEQQFKTIALGYMNPQFFKAGEQEEFINGITRRFRSARIKDISEVTMSERESVLYIGPATMEALRLRPARSIVLTSGFQGFNLLPKEEGNYLISCRGVPFRAQQLLETIEKLVKHDVVTDQTYSIYKTENINNSYLDVMTVGEDHFPFYQTYAVLWNFILGLSEVDLPVSAINVSQVQLIDSHMQIVKKLTRLHEYAMVSLDVILKEAKAPSANVEVIEGHLKNLRDMDAIFESIAKSHSLLKPVLDFYRIRRGQNQGSTLLEQVQNSILVYHEEHQVLQAMNELLEKFRQSQSLPLSK